MNDELVVLYVDDSETMQTIAEITLRDTGLVYVGARTAEEGYRLATERQPVLVLIDAMMPGATGYDLCARIKADPELQGVIVIIVCGNSAAYDPARGAHAGADGTLSKPWDSQVMLDKLREIIETGAAPVAAGPPEPKPGAAAPTPMAAAPRSQSILGMPSVRMPPAMPSPPPPAPGQPPIADDFEPGAPGAAPMLRRTTARPDADDDGPTQLPGAFEPEFDDDVSVDLSEHIAIGRAEVQDAVRMSRQMKAVEVPAELLETPAKPLYVDENVQFTIYRPKAMPPAKWHPLLAFAHLAEKRDEQEEVDPIEEVQRQAQQVLGADAERFTDTTQDATAAIPAEGELTIVPELAGVEVNPKARTFLWTEPVHREEFRIRAGAALDGQTARGKVTVWLGSLIVAEVPIAIRVSSTATASEAQPAAAKARPYRKIFASYSHRDSHIVDEVSRLSRALGDEYIRDWVHLRSGQVWNDQLRTLIAEADIFQLFWSSNSMTSRYCREEWEYALSLGRTMFVRPTYWEDPLPRDDSAGMPPEELVRLHFQKIRAGGDWAPPPPVKDSAPEPAKAKREVSDLKARLGVRPSEAPRPSMQPTPGSAPPPGMSPYAPQLESKAMMIEVESRRAEAQRRTPWGLLALLIVVIAAAVAWFVLR